jgi:hypothetical protein
MADEKVRGLLAELGFDFDPSGAEKFKKTFDDLKKQLKSANKDFDAFTFEKFFNSLNRDFRSRSKILSTTMKANLALVAIEVGRMAKDVLGQTFRAFATKEEAEFLIQTKIGEEGLENIKKSISGIKPEAKGMIKEIDILNASYQALLTSGEKGVSLVLGNIERIAMSAVQTQTSFGDVASRIIQFYLQGGIENLKNLGFTPEQVQEMQKRGFDKLTTDKTMMSARGQFLQEGLPKLQTEKFFKEYGGTLSGLGTQVGTEYDKALQLAGEEVLKPVIKEIFSLRDMGVIDYFKMVNKRNYEIWKQQQQQKPAIGTQNNTININSTEPEKVRQELQDYLNGEYQKTQLDSENETVPLSRNDSFRQQFFE